jgi:hypothetical protein
MVSEHMELIGLEVLIMCKPNPLWVYYGKTEVPSSEEGRKDLCAE